MDSTRINKRTYGLIDLAVYSTLIATVIIVFFG